jgi:hypothetical protein
MMTDDEEEILESSDRDTIHPDEWYEMTAWCQMFGVTADNLKRAIEAVGPSALKVKLYINQHHLNESTSLDLNTNLPT